VSIVSCNVVMTLKRISVKCAADVHSTEMLGPSVPSRVRKLVDRYSEIGKTSASPFDDVTLSANTAGSRGQSPVPGVVGGRKESELEG